MPHESQILSVADRISESRYPFLFSYVEQIREILLEETLPVPFLTLEESVYSKQLSNASMQ